MWMLLLATAAAGKCSEQGLNDLVEALRVVEDDSVMELTAMGVGEACSFGKGLDEALRSVAQVSPEHRSVLDARAVAEAPLVWSAACRGGLQVAAELGALAPDRHRSALWTRCALEETGLFTEAEWASATGALFTPLLVRQALVEANVPEETARVVARGLAGYSLKVRPRVVREFQPLFRAGE